MIVFLVGILVGATGRTQLTKECFSKNGRFKIIFILLLGRILPVKVVTEALGSDLLDLTSQIFDQLIVFIIVYNRGFQSSLLFDWSA